MSCRATAVAGRGHSGPGRTVGGRVAGGASRAASRARAARSGWGGVSRCGGGSVAISGGVLSGRSLYLANRPFDRWILDGAGGVGRRTPSRQDPGLGQRVAGRHPGTVEHASSVEPTADAVIGWNRDRETASHRLLAEEGANRSTLRHLVIPPGDEIGVGLRKIREQVGIPERDQSQGNVLWQAADECPQGLRGSHCSRPGRRRHVRVEKHEVHVVGERRQGVEDRRRGGVVHAPRCELGHPQAQL